MSRYVLGRMVFEVEGDSLIADSVRTEASSLPCSSVDPNVIYRFGNRDQPLERFEEGRFGQTFRANVSGMSVSYRNDGNQVSVDILARTPRSQAIWPLYEMRRIADWNFLYPHETTAKNFWYNVFDWTTQVSNIGLGQSWVHASAVSKGHRCIAFLAKGGVGKTTAMLKLCLEDGWNYLSDDLALVDDSGTVYRSPKRIQVYAYNMEAQPVIKKALMGRRSLADRVSWEYRLRRFGSKGVRRRVSAEDLMGREACQSARITDAVFLERDDGQGCRMSNADARTLAEMMTPIVMDEMNPYARVSQIAKGLLPESLEKETRQVLEKALSSSRPSVVKVGRDVSPDELHEFIRSTVI